MEKGTKVIIDVENMFFAGTGKVMEDYKANVLEHANQVGTVQTELLAGLVSVKFSDCTIVVPKIKLIIL